MTGKGILSEMTIISPPFWPGFQMFVVSFDFVCDLGEHFKFKETIVLGTTDFTPPEVEQVIEFLGQFSRLNQCTFDPFHSVGPSVGPQSFFACS